MWHQCIPKSHEQYKETKWIFKAKIKLENWKSLPNTRDLLVLKLQGHQPSNWKHVLTKWEWNLLRHAMEALQIITDPNYKLVFLKSTLGYDKKQIYLG